MIGSECLWDYKTDVSLGAIFLKPFNFDHTIINVSKLVILQKVTTVEKDASKHHKVSHIR